MAGIYGIDPIYTYTYEDSSFNQINSCSKEFIPPNDSLMYYLEDEHPILFGHLDDYLSAIDVAAFRQQVKQPVRCT